MVFSKSRNETLEVNKASEPHTPPSSSPELCWVFGSAAAAESLQRPQQLVLAGPVRHHVAVLLQQDAVQRVLVVDVAPHHQDVLAALAQLGAVAHVGHPQELAVLQAEAVPVGVQHLDVVASLLTDVQLAQHFAPEN